MAEIVQLLVSPVHRFDGRPDVLPPAPDETVDEIVVRAHLGVVGDRYFNRPAHRDASITIMAVESLAAWSATSPSPAPPSTSTSTSTSTPTPGPESEARRRPEPGLTAVRRNVLLRGVDVDEGRGRVLSLDSGDGPVLLLAHRPAHPCRWLDVTVGPGAWRGLRGRGGMRCEPLTDGVLRVGPVRATWTDPVVA